MSAATAERPRDWRALADPPATQYRRPSVFVVGPSGSGKSSSLRNLDPARTVVIDTEGKSLPFRHAAAFKKAAHPRTFAEFTAALQRAVVADADVVVVDSFSGAAELAYSSIVRPEVSDTRSGWAQYRHAIGDMLALAKAPDRHVVWLGLDEAVQDEQMRLHRTIAVQGSWKGRVEAAFEIVLGARLIDERHVFITNGEPGLKSPADMFADRQIDNDLSAVLQAVDNYYNPATP